MTTQTPLQVALDKRIPPILEQLERLRRDCGLQYLADVCLKHANALAELALRAEGYDVGGTNCIPHLLASLGVLERDMVRIEVASTDLATSPLASAVPKRPINIELADAQIPLIFLIIRRLRLRWSHAYWAGFTFASTSLGLAQRGVIAYREKHHGFRGFGWSVHSSRRLG